MWQMHTFDVTTGQIRRRLPVPRFSWTRTVRDGGISGPLNLDRGATPGDEGARLSWPWSAFEIDGRLPPAADLSAMLMPGRVGILLRWNETPWIMGIIGERDDEMRDGISFPVEGLQWLLEKRTSMRNANNPQDRIQTRTVSYSGIGRGTLMKRAVELALGRGGLPILLPPDQAIGAGEWPTTFRGYELERLRTSRVLADFANMADGPEVDFRPVMVDAQFCAWQMVVGREGNPWIIQSRQHTISTSGKWAVGGFKQRISADDMATRVWVTGAGEDEGVLMGIAEDLTYVRQGWPMMEAVEADRSLDTQARVDAHARAHLAARGRPLAQWSCVMRADGPIPLGTMWPGDMVNVRVKGHPTIPDGEYQRRVMEMSGSNGREITIMFDVAPAA